MSETLYYLSLTGKYPFGKPLWKKRSLARDCSNDAELKRMKKFNATFGTNVISIKLPKFSVNSY